MVINEGLSEAIDNFENSNLLSFARSLSLLLAETAKNNELCDYIAENGGKVNLKKGELVVSYQSDVDDQKIIASIEKAGYRVRV